MCYIIEQANVTFEPYSLKSKRAPSVFILLKRTHSVGFPSLVKRASGEPSSALLRDRRSGWRSWVQSRMEYAQSLFGWISEPPSASDEPPSPHLPPPDFLSVRRSGRGQVGQATPTGAKLLTPLELRLKDLIVDLYSDQDSSTALSRLSESELSEIDSGNFSDRPSTEPHPTSPSPEHTMTETTPHGLHDNSIPIHQEQATLFPNFFSADDIAHVSEDPQLPSLGEAGGSHFQFGVRGLPHVGGTSPRSPPHSSLSLLHSQEVLPPQPNSSSLSSLPLYSHTEFKISSSTAGKVAPSDLHSLVSRSFQIEPPQQYHPEHRVPSPKTTPKTALTTPSFTSTTPPTSQATPPVSLLGLPHMQQTTSSAPEVGGSVPEVGGSVTDENTSSEEASSSPDSDVLPGPAQTEMHDHEDSVSATSVSSQLEDGFGQQRSSSKDAPNDIGISQTSQISGDRENLPTTPTTVSQTPQMSGDGGILPTTPNAISQPPQMSGEGRNVPTTPTTLSRPPQMSGEGRNVPTTPTTLSRPPQLSGEGRNVPTTPTTLSCPPQMSGDGGVSPTTPARSHLPPDSPLSPKDIRDRLADITQQRAAHRGGLGSLLTFGLVAPSKKPSPGEEERPVLQDVVNSADHTEDVTSAVRAAEEETDGGGWEGKKGELQQTEGDDDVTSLHHFEDVETSSVLSIEQLTESLHRDSPQPVPLPPPSHDREKTPTPLDDVTSSHTVPLPLFSSPSTIYTAPRPSKYSKTDSSSSPMRMPEHLKPAHKSAHMSLPPRDLTLHQQDQLTRSLLTSTHTWSKPLPPHPELSATYTPAMPQVAASSGKQLADALHTTAHLEGQLQSVVEECRVLLTERAELNSRLVMVEAELERLRREARQSTDHPHKSMDMDAVQLREELKLSQTELKRERKALEAAKEDSSRGRMSVQRLQRETEEMKKRAEAQEAVVEDLKEKLRKATNQLDEERLSTEETQHQLHSLQGGYKALDDSKVWMQEQLQEALELKIKLQEELREAKATSITNVIQIDQLTRENTSFQQQIANLQKGVLQDKAKLVNELEAIEADVLSREDAYTQLVSEKSQLEGLAQQRAEEIAKLSATVGQLQAERDELRGREDEREEREVGLSQQCHDLQKSKGDVERRLREIEEELAGKEEDIEQLQKTKLSLQEKLRQSEAALVSKDGALQGLRDSRDILSRELDMVRQAQQRVEGELEEERRQVARLEASLGAAEEGDSRDKAVKSLTEIQQHLETENHTLRERLAVRESEVKERERDVATAQAQCQDTTARLEDLLGQFHSTVSERDTMREGIVERDRTIKRLSEENLANREEAASYKSDRDRLQTRLNTTLQQKSRLEGQLSEQSSLGELEHLQVAVRERTALQKQLDSLKLTHQQELLRAQARQGQTEAELKNAKREVERARSQVEKARQAKEETAEKMTELKSRMKLEIDRVKSAFEVAQAEKQAVEREAVSLRAELEGLQEQVQKLQQNAEIMREKLVHESVQKGEVERASGMVALKLKQNAEERERELRDQNQSLSLELERLKGRLAGISTTQQATRIHTGELESALAQRESALAQVSAEVRRLVEEQHVREGQVTTQTSLLKEEVASLRAEITDIQEELHSKQEHVNELSEKLTQTSNELSQVKLGQSIEGKSIPALEERVSRLLKERDELHTDLTTVRGQLVMAKTATETSERELADRRAQVEILHQKLSALDAQCKQVEREVEELRRQRRGESAMVVEAGGRMAAFDTSLSSIGGDEEADNPALGPHGEFYY